MILNIHRVNVHNVGDRAASPLLYFDLGPGAMRADVHDLWRASPAERERQTRVVRESLVIVGGGGLIYDEWRDKLRRVSDVARCLVLWGLGLNTHDEATGDAYPSWCWDTDLVGVRDWGVPLPWVPCPSCMSRAFDRAPEPDCEAVVYDHAECPVPVRPEVPRSSNTSHYTMERAVEFLARGRIVLTSSYHGAYWASLLGRRVVCWPFSSRFHRMRHAPALIRDGDDWRAAAKRAAEYPEALGECRAANISFAEKVNALRATLTL